MRSASVLVATLVACTSRFGLDPVALDDDADGIIDVADNCPDLANPDQEDWDRNGIGDACDTCMAPSGVDLDADGIDDVCDGCVGPGRTGTDEGRDGIDDGCEPCPAATGDDLDEDGVDDACDTCLRGPEHDEDGDGIADACDVCPSRYDPMQAQSTDNDRLGDACDPDVDPLDPDPSAGDQATRLFDGFGSSSSAWPAGALPIASDAARLTADTGVTARVQLASRFLIETVVQLAPSASVSIALRPVVCAGGPCSDEQTSCVLDSDGTLMVSTFGGNPVSVPGVAVDGPVRLWFRTRPDRVKSSEIVQMCIAIDRHGNVVRAVAAPEGQLPLLALDVAFAAAGGDAQLDYVWLVAN